jgi:hypothetical protein
MTTAFIEKQFPVSKVSKESYKERKAQPSFTCRGADGTASQTDKIVKKGIMT